TEVAPDEIVASFPITSHFDIQQEYNSATGEVLNILSENTADRPWYQREYIRVDWVLNCNLIDSSTTAIVAESFHNAKVPAVEQGGDSLGTATLDAFLAYEQSEQRSFFVAEHTM